MLTALKNISLIGSLSIWMNSQIKSQWMSFPPSTSIFHEQSVPCTANLPPETSPELIWNNWKLSFVDLKIKFGIWYLGLWKNFTIFFYTKFNLKILKLRNNTIFFKHVLWEHVNSPGKGFGWKIADLSILS